MSSMRTSFFLRVLSFWKGRITCMERSHATISQSMMKLRRGSELADTPEGRLKADRRLDEEDDAEAAAAGEDEEASSLAGAASASAAVVAIAAAVSTSAGLGCCGCAELNASGRNCST